MRQFVLDAWIEMTANSEFARNSLWCEREKQIGRIITNTAGMYGDVGGLIGAGMPEIQLLAVEAAVLEENIDQ